MRITVYTKPDCHLCEDALDILDRLTPEYGLVVNEVNILDDTALYEEYHNDILVVAIEEGNLGTLRAPIDEAGLRMAFDIARRAYTSTRSVLPTGPEPMLDRIARYIGQHWLRIASIALGIFVGLPWLAPVFAAMGWWALADPIYTMYAFTCHQLPERAGTVMGYQVAFCFRNTALYGGVFLFGLLYGSARGGKVSWLRWLNKPIPWWVFALLLLPMAVDGFTHMLGLRDGMGMMDPNMPMDPAFGSFYFGSQPFSLNWWLRIITGFTAALGAIWFAYPRMQRAVSDSEALRLMYLQSSKLKVEGSRLGS